MLKGTLNSSLRLIRTKNLYSDGDELSVVYCISDRILLNVMYVMVETMRIDDDNDSEELKES